MTYAINAKGGVHVARPRKCRRVCALPAEREFVPAGGCGGREPVILTVDEYETIRLIDREGLSQEDCGTRMEIARTTVQQIYTGARKKLADALVEGRPLRIGGGDYRICGEGDFFCGCPHCRRRHGHEENTAYSQDIKEEP